MQLLHLVSINFKIMKRNHYLLILLFIGISSLAKAQEIYFLEDHGTIYEINDKPIDNSSRLGEEREFSTYYDRRTGMQVDSILITIGQFQAYLKPTGTNYVFWKEVGNFFPFWGEANILGCRIGYHNYIKHESADNYDLSLYATLKGDNSGIPTEILAAHSFSGDEISTGTELDSFTYIAFTGSDYTIIDESHSGFALTVALEDVTAFSDSTDIVELYSSLDGDGRSEKRAIVRLDQESFLWDGEEYKYLDKTIPKQGGGYYNFNFDVMLIPVVDVEVGVGFLQMPGLRYNGHYPNPAVDNVTIDLELDEAEDNIQISIHSLDGKASKFIRTGFLPAGKQLVQLDVSDLEEGVYLYTIKSERATFSSKLIINR